MTGITDADLREYRAEAERTEDDAYPAGPVPDRPGQARAKVLSVRLNPEEFAELVRHAEILEVPMSGLVRGWILAKLRAGSESSPAATVDRIAHDVAYLRRQLREAS